MANNTMKATNVAAMMGITVVNGDTMTKQVELADLAPEGTAPEAWVAGLIEETAKQYGCTIQRPLDLSTATGMFGAALERVQGLLDMPADEQRLHADRALREYITDMVKANLPKQTAPAPAPQMAAPAPAPAPAATGRPESDYTPTQDDLDRFALSLSKADEFENCTLAWRKKGERVTLTITADKDTITVGYRYQKCEAARYCIDGKKAKFETEQELWDAIDELFSEDEGETASEQPQAETAPVAAPQLIVPTPHVTETHSFVVGPNLPGTFYQTGGNYHYIDEQRVYAIYKGGEEVSAFTAGLTHVASIFRDNKSEKALQIPAWFVDYLTANYYADAPEDTATDDEPIDEPIDEPVDEPIDEPIDEPQTADEPQPQERMYTKNEVDAEVAMAMLRKDEEWEIKLQEAKMWANKEKDEAIAKALAEKQAEFDKILEDKANEFQKRMDQQYENVRASVMADQHYLLENLDRVFGKDTEYTAVRPAEAATA